MKKNVYYLVELSASTAYNKTDYIKDRAPENILIQEVISLPLIKGEIDRAYLENGYDELGINQKSVKALNGYMLDYLQDDFIFSDGAVEYLKADR